jgi:tetratricopeptide (TPR) repeat protein
VRHFVGRVTALEALTSLVDESDPAGHSTVITTIDGTAGIGKSALAVAWAHRVAGRFGDGQLYVNLRGFDPTGSPMSPAEAVRGFLDAFQVSPQRIPAGLDAQTGLYRSLVAGKRVLVVLDNARDAEQVRPLLPGSPGCLVVVTNRNRLSDLVANEGAHSLTLDLLSAAEARHLLGSRLGAVRLGEFPQAVDDIVTRCARLPLALAIVAARAATQPDLPLDLLAAELREAGGDLDALAGGELTADVRAIFSWSYHALGADAARLFRLLSLHPGPDITVPSAASLAGVSVAETRRILAELTRANLLVQHAVGRYTCHDLLHAYATELVRAHDSDSDRHACLHRVLDHYLHTAYAGKMRLDLCSDPLDLAAPQRGVRPEDLADLAGAMDWFTAEHTVLLTAVDRAAMSGFDAHTWQLALSMTTFLERRGHWLDLANALRIALTATERLADRLGQSIILRSLARPQGRMGHYADGQVLLETATQLLDPADDPVVAAHTHRHHSWLHELQGQYGDALHHAQQAVDLLRVAGHQSGQARALNMVGWNHARLGDHDRAITACARALSLLEEIGDRTGQAHTFDSLGYSYHHLGDHDRAVAFYRRALNLFQEIGDRFNEAEILDHLGDAHQAAGDAAQAQPAWQHAVEILDELNHSYADGIRAKLQLQITIEHQRSTVDIQVRPDAKR